MLQIKRKYINEYWFSDKPKNNDFLKLNSYVQCRTKSILYKVSHKKTLLIDLTRDKKYILQQFSKNTRYEIKKISDEDICVKVGNIKIEDYVKLYNSFAKSRFLPTITVSDLNYYWKHLEVIYVKHGSNIIALHSYLCDGERARLYHSISIFRIDSKYDKNFMARANRYLHFSSMMYFKEKNYKIYDFGGVTTFEKDKMNGIDRFKSGFGGEKIIEYNLLTYPLWLSLKLKGIYEKIYSKIR